MAWFTAVTDRMWGFVSPRRTQQQRSKPFEAPLQPLVRIPAKRRSRSLSKSPDGRPMTPNSRVRNWHIATPSTTLTVANRIPNKRVPWTPSSSNYKRSARSQTPRRRTINVDRDVEDLEGDTLVDDEEGLEAQPTPASGWNSQVEIDDTLVVPELEYEVEGYDKKFIDISAERENQEIKGVKLRAEGFTDAEVALIQKLSMSGKEPLFPQNWKIDFGILPDELFTPDDRRAFVKAAHGNDFRAIRALSLLVDLGPVVCDKIAAGRAPEATLSRAITSYIKWAERDGKLDVNSNIPLIAIEAGRYNESGHVLAARLIAKLEGLAMRYRTAFRVHRSVENSVTDESEEESRSEYTRDLPTLYGVSITHSIVAFVGYDPMAAHPVLHTLGIFDFGRSDFNVWNCLAIAILAVHARNVLMGLKEDTLEGSSSHLDDPDT
ncbi:hypothetical protein B0A49_06415 [Cryomyces minteri]|uniref:Uncharacterized protein n=1 Tax=Cryomyces minteri TaxID=331657 RepID=A0A4U0X3K9_9PEZI|nr:hypothetical protein B0A49_06415 [Cryomyces minteri]